jgi:hypothetical protein
MSITVPIFFLLHLVATAAMVGVIWIVQLTHYPAFRFVDPLQFKRFEDFHRSSISFVVIPLMLTEVVSGAFLFLSGYRSMFFVLSLFVLLLVWISTFLIQVPLHNRLGRAPDPVIIERLITTNWLRTGGWSIRIVLLLLLVETQ